MELVTVRYECDCCGTGTYLCPLFVGLLNRDRCSECTGGKLVCVGPEGTYVSTTPP